MNFHGGSLASTALHVARRGGSVDYFFRFADFLGAAFLERAAFFWAVFDPELPPRFPPNAVSQPSAYL
jgi:hypothetical protein